MMRTSKNGVALIKRFEGLELEAYQDIAGVWTIGYGFTGKYPDWLRFPLHRITDRVGPGQTITEADAERLLVTALASREADLNGWMIVNGVILNQNRFDALVSFIYNVGFSAFKRSTAARRIVKGDWEGAADALTWWSKATVGGKLVVVHGLERRRAAEKALFLTPPEASAPAINPAVQSNVARPDHLFSGACPAKECRPVVTRFPRCFHGLRGKSARGGSAHS